MATTDRCREILDKWEFFYGQRAGRELWSGKPRDVQDKDIADFNRDMQIVRSALRPKGEPMRVEVIHYDTYYREHYFCPKCNIEIGHKTWDEKYQFGQGTVLHSNKFPNFCPNCGADMRNEVAPEVMVRPTEKGYNT